MKITSPVTSIRMPVETLGRVALDELLCQLNGEPPRDLPVPTEPELVLRSSTAPPPATRTRA